MSFENLGLWTVEILKDGEEYLKVLPCFKLKDRYCSHCGILQKFQELLQVWREKFPDMGKKELDQAGYVIVESNSHSNNLIKRSSTNSPLRLIRSAHYSYDSPINREIQMNFPIEHAEESPINCEMQRKLSKELDVESPIIREMQRKLFKEHAVESTINREMQKNIHMEHNIESSSSIQVLSNEKKVVSSRLIRDKSEEKHAKQRNPLPQQRTSFEFPNKSSIFKEIMKRLQIKNSKVEGKSNPNYDGAEISPRNEAKEICPKKKKLPRMNSTEVIAQETRLVNKIPFKTYRSLEQLEPIKPVLPPRRASTPLKGNICDTPLPFIPIGGYLDIRRNREMPPLSDLSAVTRVANIVVNKTKLGRRFIAKVQNEMFVYKAIHDLYVDFTLDLNCTHFCNSTNLYLILQNNVMCMTITFCDKKSTDIWSSITSENRINHAQRFTQSF